MNTLIDENICLFKIQNNHFQYKSTMMSNYCPTQSKEHEFIKLMFYLDGGHFQMNVSKLPL